MTRLELHPDRFFPASEPERSTARRIFDAIEGLPIVSPHGHLDASLFALDAPFADPATLFVSDDHYVVRLLHSRGVPLAELGLSDRGSGTRADPRTVWRHLCAQWRALAGTPSRAWLEHELSELCGLTEQPSPATADETFDALVERLASDDMRPRALYRRFGLEVLTTTDSPLDDLAVHARLAADPSWQGRLLPTFRPDEVVDPGRVDFADKVARLGSLVDIDTSSYSGYLEALQRRREQFIALGATASDHGVFVRTTERLGTAAATAIFERSLKGEASEQEVEALRGHLLDEQARMSADDGLVMQLHVGVIRDYNAAVLERFGADVGQDFPVAMEFSDCLRPLLGRYGESALFSIVLYTVDESTFSREIGPLASYFPSVYAGAPWWFLDAPDAMMRALSRLSETAGMARLAGFVDDTRSFFGIGARHDLARRVCAAHLARLVCEHRIGEDEATDIAVGYAYRQPRSVFKVAPA